MRKILVVVFLLIIIMVNQPVSHLEASFVSPNSLVSSCVSIKAYNNDLLAKQGSGFAVKDNEIITCYHVIDGCTSLKVVDSKGMFRTAVLHRFDKDNDIAILKTDKVFVPVKFTSKVYVGEDIWCISSPINIQNVMSKGIISKINVVINNKSRHMFTAAISRGSSGGLVLNSRGEAVGMVVSYLPDGNDLNCVIPFNIIARVFYKEV